MWINKLIKIQQELESKIIKIEMYFNSSTTSNYNNDTSKTTSAAAAATITAANFMIFFL